MKKLFLLIPALAITLLANATNPTITIDGNKSDWAEVPMLSEPGVWPMLKVLPAADANLGSNALVYMMENTEDFDPTWAQYPNEFIDKDYDGSTNTIDAYWGFSAMGLEYRATTGVQVGESWISFPKAMSSDNKVFEIGFPATYITDLGEKFGFAMYYNSGAWYCPDRSTPAKESFSPANGFLYKTRSFTTVAGTTNLTTANVYAHPSMGEVGEYVDFGLRDNGYDTLRWAAFPIELTQPAVYDVTVNTSAPSSTYYKFELWLVDVASNAVVAHIARPASSVSSSSYLCGKLDLTSVPAGKYMLKVMNKKAYSKIRLNSIDLTYAGGAAVNVPGTLNFDDVILSSEAWVAKNIVADSIFFTAHGSEGHNSINYAKWKVNVTTPAAYNFKANVYRKSGHQEYEIKVLSNDENDEFASNALSNIQSGSSYISSGTVYLEPGIYTVKVRNTYDYADGALLGVVAEYIGGAVQAMPGTTDINEAWFSANGTRADGKISFPESTIQDGWVKWNVSFANVGNYNVIVNIDNTNDHNYTVALYESENDNDPIIVSEGEQKSTIGTLELGAMEVPAGNYILKVTNAIQWSNAKLISVKFEYVGGGIVNIPGSVALNEAILSNRAFIDADGLHFTDNDHLGTISEEYAKWNIHADGGIYKFTAHCSSTNYSNLTIQVLDANENELYSYTPQYTYKQDDKEISSPDWFLAEGDYILKLSNPANHSNGFLLSLAVTAQENVIVLDDNATDAAYIHAVNGENKKIVINRTFKGGMYNTICLPFTDWMSSVKAIFGEDVELLELSSTELDGSTLNLNFTAPSELGHGRPYLIKPAQDVKNPIWNGRTINDGTSYNIKSCTNADFIGNFIKSEVPAGENNLFLGPDNLLYFSQDATPIKGMRAYFQVKGVSNPSQAIKHARIVMNGQVATDLENTMVNGKCQNGKYILDGQLVIIRDGVRYNAMGIMMK